MQKRCKSGRGGRGRGEMQVMAKLQVATEMLAIMPFREISNWPALRSYAAGGEESCLGSVPLTRFFVLP